ncbi:histidine phosphatase family protein [[Eubacterium] cellulosolvens]
MSSKVGRNLSEVICERVLGNENFAVLLRHSVREPIRYDVNHERLHLTEEGRRMAFEFGGQLPLGKSIRLFYSPVPRCRETAERIHEGIVSHGGTGKLMGVRDFLGVPFIDFQSILDQVKPIGFSTFTRRWLNSQLDVKIIDDPRKAFRKMINGIVSTLTENDRDSIDLYVSHDWNLLLIKEFFLGIKHEDAGLPDYLDGVILIYKEGTITAVYEGVKNTIDWNHCTI